MKSLNKNTIVCDDIVFKKYISNKNIEKELTKLSIHLNQYYYGKTPMVIGILNGSIYFMIDLLNKVNFKYEIDFIKSSSYKGTERQTLTLDKFSNTKFKNKEILIIEDIIDSGQTMNKIYQDLQTTNPKDIKIVSLLNKHTKKRKISFNIDWVGFNIVDKYVIGYGMDYNNLFRYLKDIYIKDE